MLVHLLGFLLFLLFELVDVKNLPLERHSIHRRKSARSSKRHKKHYGVSLASVTGFEKPMIPPHIINYELPINRDRGSKKALEYAPNKCPNRFPCGCPCRWGVLNETTESIPPFLIYPLQ